MTDYAALLRALAAGRVEFIIVGGLAATIHGAARATYLRGAPAGLPFTWDVETLSKGLNSP